MKYNLESNRGYMEYDFSSLNIIERLTPEIAKENFIYFFNLRKIYIYSSAFNFDEIESKFIHEKYLVMNNHPRYKGKAIFFTGHAVIVDRCEIIEYMRIPIDIHNLINPLLIIPFGEDRPPYMISCQEDPIFEYYEIGSE